VVDHYGQGFVGEDLDEGFDFSIFLGIVGGNQQMFHPIGTQRLVEAMLDVLPHRGKGAAVVGHELSRYAIGLDRLLHPGNGRIGRAVETHMHIEDIATVVILDDEHVEREGAHREGTFEIDVPQIIGLVAFPALIVDAGTDGFRMIGAHLHMITAEDAIDAGMGERTDLASLQFSRDALATPAQEGAHRDDQELVGHRNTAGGIRWTGRRRLERGHSSLGKRFRMTPHRGHATRELLGRLRRRVGFADTGLSKPVILAHDPASTFDFFDHDAAFLKALASLFLLIGRPATGHGLAPRGFLFTFRFRGHGILRD